MTDETPLSPAGRAFVALACLAAGTLPILAALDVGPLHHKDIHGPPWIAGAAGGAFVFAGLAIAVGTGERWRWAGNLAGFMAALALAAVGNWIAFGVGARQCTGGVSGLLFASSRAAAEIECRLAFGIGAVMMDGILLYWLGTLLGKQFGPGRVQGAIAKIGKAILLIGISPLLLVLLVWGLASGLFGALREYLKTGRWPRNEAFIARMKARRGKPE